MCTGLLPFGYSDGGPAFNTHPHLFLYSHSGSSWPVLTFLPLPFIEQEEVCTNIGLSAQEDSAVTILMSNNQVMMCDIHTT